MSGIIPSLLSAVMLAKGAPVGGPLGPGSREVTFFLGVLGVALAVWTLVSAVLFRAGVALYNRFAALENQTSDVSFPRSLVVGFVHMGVLPIVLFVSSLALNLILTLTLSALHTMPNQALMVVWFGLALVVQIAAGWLTKALLSTAFVPCRFGPAAIISLIWFVCEILFFLLITGGVMLAMYLTIGFDGLRF